MKRFGGLCAHREFGRTHSRQHFFGGENRSATAKEIGSDADSAASDEERLARFGESFIAANVIGIRVGVDDVSDRLRCDFFDRGQNGLSACSRTSIDNDDAIASHLNTNVSARARNEVEVR